MSTQEEILKQIAELERALKTHRDSQVKNLNRLLNDFHPHRAVHLDQYHLSPSRSVVSQRSLHEMPNQRLYLIRPATSVRVFGIAQGLSDM